MVYGTNARCFHSVWKRKTSHSYACACKNHKNVYSKRKQQHGAIGLWLYSYFWRYFCFVQESRQLKQKEFSFRDRLRILKFWSTQRYDVWIRYSSSSYKKLNTFYAKKRGSGKKLFQHNASGVDRLPLKRLNWYYVCFLQRELRELRWKQLQKLSDYNKLIILTIEIETGIISLVSRKHDLFLNFVEKSHNALNFAFIDDGTKSQMWYHIHQIITWKLKCSVQWFVHCKSNFLRENFIIHSN